MGDFDGNRFKSGNQSLETPDDLFARIDAEFHFTRDVCASAENSKCRLFWTAEDSCLVKTWDGINWMNPPYKTMSKFVEKAFNERGRAVTVCLIPAKTNTIWWHKFCVLGEIYFIRGRPKFKGFSHGLPVPLAIVVFGRAIGTVGVFDLKGAGGLMPVSQAMG